MKLGKTGQEIDKTTLSSAPGKTTELDISSKVEFTRLGSLLVKSRISKVADWSVSRAQETCGG